MAPKAAFDRRSLHLLTRALEHGSLKVRPPLAFPGQTVGLMGGTFNPPHAGHASVAATALRKLALDQLWWIVTPGNPLKSRQDLAPQATRLALSRQLVRDSRIKVTGFEAELGSPYTAVTIAFLKKRYPGTHFVWVMGADSLVQFHAWKAWRWIAAMVPIAAVDRPGWRLKAAASPFARLMVRSRVPEARAGGLARRPAPAWTLLSMRLSPLSSTELRRAAPVSRQ